uniref:Ras-associating domain-containing protein n=1 Tax=Timema poppense TaxID=170557 RepID=A0A7R9DIQ8_TIMPO|nr:unnamed protein product [Timema poppensis]
MNKNIVYNLFFPARSTNGACAGRRSETRCAAVLPPARRFSSWHCERNSALSTWQSHLSPHTLLMCACAQQSNTTSLALFSLQTRRGGLVKIYDSILMPASQYKSLLISDRTTVDELIQILLSCYNSKEQVEQFSLYEVCKSQEYQRKLHPDDCPLQVQQCWGSPSEFHFLIRRNLDFRPCRKTRKLLGPWTPELPTIPCSSRQNQPAPIQSSLVSDSLAKQRSSSSYTDYENYFYI